jgi:DNA modification methylase
MDIGKNEPRACETASFAISTGSESLSDCGVDRYVEVIAVDLLKPSKVNARTHSRKQIRQIADSVARFGFCNPVLIDDADRIIAGHGRVQAAKVLGLTAVPALRLSHLSDAEKRAYVLADNRLAELAGWDKEILAVELQGLLDLNFEVELTGFDMGTIDIILNDADEARAEGADGPEDQLPEPTAGPAVSQVGDLWILGEHRLLCGDARDEGTYRRLLDGGKAQLVFADPPYNVSIDGNVCGLGNIRHRDFAMASGEMTSEEFTAFLTSVFDRLVVHAIDGAIHFICIDWRHIAEMMAAGNAVYTELKNLCVWTKTNGGMGTFYRSRHELIFVWKSGTASHINNFELGQRGRSRTNVWEYPGISTARPGRLDELALHPTVKPVALVADAIKDCSRRDGIVLDPFTGSGTTLIAAERTGRRARGIEIDPVYVDVAIRRWQSFTGKSATLAGTSKTFEEIEEEQTSGEMGLARDQAAPANRGTA